MQRLWLLIGMLLLAGCISAPPPVAEDRFLDVKRCAAEGPRRQVCYDTFIRNYAGARTTKELLAELQTAMDADEAVKSTCHGIAHAIGRLNFERAGNAQDALAQCEFTCFSGCLHGSVERVFFTQAQMDSGQEHADLETVKKAIPTLCRSDEMPDSTPHTLGQCVHGVGHAVMFALDYAYLDALSMCDLFSPDNRPTCFTGVAMENISASDARKRHLKPEDILFPCNTLEDRHASACYYYQPTYMMERGMTMEQISSTCLSVNKFAGDCIEGYSREFDLIFIRNGDTASAVRFCEELSGAYSAECIGSTIRSSIINFNDGSTAYTFCSALTKPGNREMCTQAVAAHFKHQLLWGSEQLRSDCHRFAGAENPICSQTLSAFAEI